MSNETLASELLHMQKATIKRLFIVLFVVIGLWFATIAGFIIYNSLPEEVTETIVDQQTDKGGDNQIVGGDYYNGTAEDNAESDPAQEAP